MIISVSVMEILAFTAMMITIISGWVALKVKIQKYETTAQLKFLELEKKIADSNDHHNEWVAGIGRMVDKFLTDNKEEHKELMRDVKEIRQSINEVNITIAGLRHVIHEQPN